MINAVGELGVLLESGLTLDRALGVCVDNQLEPTVRAEFAAIHEKVKTGVPLSRAMAEGRPLFPPVAAAMCEAGEADGRLGPALTRLSESLERAEDLRQVVVSSMVYPATLCVVAGSVILMILLVVVPQFEGLFAGERARLPFATRMVMGASEGVRSYGLVMAVLIVALAFPARRVAPRGRPRQRAALDRMPS